MTARTARKGKSKYKVINWPEYDSSLVNRGNINIWLDEDAIAGWHPKHADKQHGRQSLYSDLAIQACLTMRLVYGLALGSVNKLKR